MINIDDRLLMEVTPDQLWLLCHIAKHIGKDMSCFPSNATLCAATGWSISKLNQVKKECLESGLLRVERRFNASAQASNLYFIETHFISIAVNLKGKGGPDTPVSNEAPPCFISNTPPVSNETPEVLTNEVLKHSAESEKDSAYGFLEFWEDYAFKRGSKRKACERWGKLTGRDRDEIKRTLPYYLRSTTTDRRNDRKGEFKPMRKYPEFYLSARQWESQADELAEQIERDETPTEWDGAYMEYLQWVKARYPNLLHDTKHMSKAQYIEYKTTYYVTGKSRLGDDLERQYMIRSHEQMNTSDGIRRDYHDVFALHCEKVKEFIKSQPV